MKFGHIILAATVLAATAQAGATNYGDLRLEHLTLSNIRSSGDTPAQPVVVSTAGLTTRLSFDGWGDYVHVDSSAGPTYLDSSLAMLATPDQGFAVKSLTFSARLDVDLQGPPLLDWQYPKYTFYFESPGLLGTSLGMAETDFTESHKFGPEIGVEPMIDPFTIRVYSGAETFGGLSASQYQSLSFRDITLDIELVQLPVPEPSSWLMITTGMLAVGVAARRRKT
ncbi:PEP-CTERM sorting domain-containing protein [Pseudoduganella lutea]|nr:PEP-CTERM sorting domain-containing protein [Pseudoduganella lutea]